MGRPFQWIGQRHLGVSSFTRLPWKPIDFSAPVHCQIWSGFRWHRLHWFEGCRTVIESSGRFFFLIFRSYIPIFFDSYQDKRSNNMPSILIHENGGKMAIGSIDRNGHLNSDRTRSAARHQRLLLLDLRRQRGPGERHRSRHSRGERSECCFCQVSIQWVFLFCSFFQCRDDCRPSKIRSAASDRRPRSCWWNRTRRAARPCTWWVGGRIGPNSISSAVDFENGFSFIGFHS